MGSKTKSSVCPLYLLGQEGVAQRNSLHDGDIADLEGSISELFAWCRWKRETGQSLCLSAGSGLGRDCHRACWNQAVIPGVSQAVEQLCKWLLAESWVGVALPDMRVGQGPAWQLFPGLCMGERD